MPQGLLIELSSRFGRDVRHLEKKHVRVELLREVITLVAQNDTTALQTLRQRHRMHDLRGEWAGAKECDVAVFLRTGSDDEIFR